MRCLTGRQKRNSAHSRRFDVEQTEIDFAETTADRHIASKTSRHARDGIIALLSDPTVDLDGTVLVAFLASFPADDRVHEAMIGRAFLPPEVIQKLGTLVAQERLPALIARHVAPEGSMARGHRGSLGSLQETTASARSA